MEFANRPFLPEPQEHPGYLEAIRLHIRTAFATPVEALLQSFFGRPLQPSSFALGGLHHVAVYVGDYRDESDVERWHASLRRCVGVADLETGPSHIAPRYHGAPGWWASCLLGGLRVELFTVRHMGAWARLSPAERAIRMSHHAVRVLAARDVHPLLEYFARWEGMRLLAYAADDVLGHTYGHLLSEATGHVLELVHDEGALAPPDARSRSASADEAAESGRRGPPRRVSENQEGRWYVDTSCIDCDTCRCVSPLNFRRNDEMSYSYVVRQPVGEEEEERVEEAAECCPVGAIHCGADGEPS